MRQKFISRVQKDPGAGVQGGAFPLSRKNADELGLGCLLNAQCHMHRGSSK